MCLLSKYETLDFDREAPSQLNIYLKPIIRYLFIYLCEKIVSLSSRQCRKVFAFNLFGEKSF